MPRKVEKNSTNSEKICIQKRELSRILFKQWP